MAKTKIEWTNETWNPVTGCTKISIGCKNCYAERIAYRFAGLNFPARPNHFKVTLHPERLDQPLHMKKPRMIFVCSMSDLFHEDVPAEFIIKVFEVMAACPQHTFQVLTKRPALAYARVLHGRKGLMLFPDGEYLSNVWLGITAETQDTFSERWPSIIWSGKTFISCEPLLSPLDLSLEIWDDKPDWVIVGGETGAGWRYHDGVVDVPDEWQEELWFDWARDIREQCKAAGIPFFFKKPPGGGKLYRDGFTKNTPQELRIRQMPERSE